jgi:rhamnosyltransferase subunit B
MNAKRIVLAAIGSLGDLHPAVALALELQARGHQVKLATFEAYRENIEKSGISFHPLRPNLFDQDTELIEKMMHPTKGTKVIFKQVLGPAIKDTYTDLIDIVGDADLIVAGETVFAAVLVAEKTGIPLVNFILQPCSFFSIYDPPFLAAASYFYRFSWLGRNAMKSLKVLAKFSIRDWVKPIRELRKELNLSDDPNPMFEGKYSPNLVLALFSHVLGAPQPDWPPQTLQTGFTFYDRADNRGLSPQIKEFLANGEPPIVFTLGSAAVLVAGDFYRQSLEAVKLLGCRAIFLIGDAGKLENLPDGTIADNYAPYGELFPHAAAIVHQGGIGTTAQALRAGVPMLVVPFSHDQPDNAARIVRLGVGRTIKREDYQPNLAAQELQQLLGNASYKNRALEIQQIIAAENGVKTASDAIEKNLASRVQLNR